MTTTNDTRAAFLDYFRAHDHEVVGLALRVIFESLQVVGAEIEAGAVTPQPQVDEQATYSPKITRDLTRIRWDRPPGEIARQVRAFDPKPGAWTTLEGQQIKLFGPRSADQWETDELPGEVVETDPAFVVSTGGANGALQFLDVQPAGRRRMAASEWLRGHGTVKGGRFT